MTDRRVGLVGAGFAARAHSWGLRQTPALGCPVSFNRVRVADLQAAAAERAAREFSWREWTDDWRRVTDADDIDTVAIVTPNDTHREVVAAAAQAGKAIICEKPLAATLADAEAILADVNRTSVPAFVAFVYRTWPSVAFAADLIRAGNIGRVLRFRGSFRHDYGLDRSQPMSWRYERARAGAGALGDIGSHVIDLARFLIGDVSTILARSGTVVETRPSAVDGSQRQVDVDDFADVLLTFAEGATGAIEVSWVAAGAKTEIAFEVLGDEGAIRFHWGRPMELQVLARTDSATTAGFRTIVLGSVHAPFRGFWPVAGHQLGWADGFALMYDRVGRALIGESERDLATFADGVAAARVVDAALCSAASGEWQFVRRSDAST